MNIYYLTVSGDQEFRNSLAVLSGSGVSHAVAVKMLVEATVIRRLDEN